MIDGKEMERVIFTKLLCVLIDNLGVQIDIVRIKLSKCVSAVY